MKKLIWIFLTLIFSNISFGQTVVTELWTPPKLAGLEATLKISPDGDLAYFYKVGQAARPDSLFLIVYNPQKLELAMLVENDGYIGDTIDLIVETGQWKGSRHIAFIRQTGTGNIVKTYYTLDVTAIAGPMAIEPPAKNILISSPIKITPLARTFKFTLPQSSDATLEITTSNGSSVKELSLKDARTISWDGLDRLGNKVQSGNYQFRIKQNGNVYSGSVQVVR